MRAKPYTSRGIRRVPCLRCGKASRHQWQICSLGKGYKGVCETCDIKLNKLVLDFFKVKDRAEIIKNYTSAAKRAEK